MQLSRTLESDFKVLPQFIREALDAIKKEFPLSEEDIFDLTLVLEEALTNAIKHGNKSAPELKVQVEIKSDKNRLMMKVKNGGPGFDPQKVPDPTRKDKLMKTSGRGVYLIRKTMDEVRFEDNGREIHMVKVFKARPKG